MFLFCLVFAMFCARLFICALWSPAGKGLTSWLSFVVSSVSLSLSHWYPGSGWYLIVSIPDLCNLITLQSPVLEFDKNCTQTLIFFKKLMYAFLNTKNREVIENSPQTPLNFRTLQCTYLGKKVISMSLGLSQKKRN